MSFLDSLGGAMGNAAHGAMLGQAIGNANKRADFAEDKADEWYNYAKRLEAELAQSKAVANRATEKNKMLEESNKKLDATVSEHRKEIHQTSMSWAQNKTDTVNFYRDYGRLIARRTRAMEKALQHASADVEALKALLVPYQELVEKMRLHGELPPDLEKKAQEAWEKFNNGEMLSSNPAVQAEAAATPDTEFAMRMFGHEKAP